MPTACLLSNGEPGEASHFARFRDEIGPYANTFGLSPADLSRQASDANYYDVLLSLAKAMSDAAQKWSNGGGFTGSTPLDCDIFSPAVPPSTFDHFLALVATVKNHKNYTLAIGQILGIEEPDRGADKASRNAWIVMLRVLGLSRIMYGQTYRANQMPTPRSQKQGTLTAVS